MVDFEWYRSFVAIYRHNSVSEAAKTRIMTQPAMSQHLAALEAEVGEPLFTRTSRSIAPTERGKQLYSQLAPLIESLEETTMSFKAASTPSLRVVKLGAAHEFFYEKIAPRLQRFPACTVSHFGTADQLLELLKQDQVDLIVTSKKYIAPGIEYVKLGDERFFLVAPLRTEVPATDSLKRREEWLAAQSWISYGLELPIIRRLWREHFKKRPLLKPVHVLPNLHIIMRAIESGAGLSLLPDYLLASSDRERVKVIYEELTVCNELFFAFKTMHRHLPGIKEAMDIIREP